jgi:bacterioferritin
MKLDDKTPNAAGGELFNVDKATLRERARRDIEQGAVTDSYQANREAVIKMLNDALATELICVLRYKRHYLALRNPE